MDLGNIMGEVAGAMGGMGAGGSGLTGMLTSALALHGISPDVVASLAQKAEAAYSSGQMTEEGLIDEAKKLAEAHGVPAVAVDTVANMIVSHLTKK